MLIVLIILDLALVSLVAIAGVALWKGGKFAARVLDCLAELKPLVAVIEDTSDSARRLAKGASVSAQAAGDLSKLMLIMERAEVFPIIDGGQILRSGEAAVYALTVFNGGKSPALITAYEWALLPTEPAEVDEIGGARSEVSRMVAPAHSHVIAEIPLRDAPPVGFLVGRIFYSDTADQSYVAVFSIRMDIKRRRCEPGDRKLNRRRAIGRADG